MARREITKPTLKRLFALSGNQCAFPGCKQAVVNEDDDLIVNICHIEAANESGERFNSQQTDEERRSLENLILLCPTHHAVTNNVQMYPPEALKKMKADHEYKFRTQPYETPDQVVDVALGVCRLSQLIEDLNRPFPEDRRIAARQLELFKPPAKKAIANLMYLVSTDDDATVRKQAADAISVIVPTEDQVPELIALLKDEDQGVRQQLAVTFSKIDGASVVEALTESLNDQNPNVRVAVALALYWFGSRAESAGLNLSAMLKDPVAEVRASAALALGETGWMPSKSVPLLAECLNDRDQNVRHNAANALGRFGSSAINAVPSLVESTKDEDVYVRQKAIFALGNIGHASSDVVAALAEALVEALENDQTQVSFHFALISLHKLGPRAAAAVPTLVKLLEDQEDESVRRTLCEIDPSFDLERTDRGEPNE